MSCDFWLCHVVEWLSRGLHNKKQQDKELLWMPTKYISPEERQREKYLQKFSKVEITDNDYVHGGLVDMLELFHGKEVDKMIQEEEEQRRSMN